MLSIKVVNILLVGPNSDVLYLFYLYFYITRVKPVYKEDMNEMNSFYRFRKKGIVMS